MICSGRLVITLSLMVMPACKPPPELLEQVGVWQAPGASRVIMQPSPGELAAIDTATGERWWTHRIEQVRQQPYGLDPPKELSCPPVWTTTGLVIVRYDDVLLVLDGQTGEETWHKKSASFSYCPKVAPDSGILIVTSLRRALTKLSPAGVEVWQASFAAAGEAVTGPEVIFPTGDALVRTRKHLVSLNPQGSINWEVPLETGHGAKRP